MDQRNTFNKISIRKIFGFFYHYIQCLFLEYFQVKTMDIVKRVFRVGQLVYGKMKFYPPWPACILEVVGRNARVRFFGWDQQW